jgi:hypothetical protein
MRVIETGRWLGFVPASVMRFGGKQMHLKVLPVKVSSPPAPVGFITVKGRTLTPLAERFIEYIRNVAIWMPIARRRRPVIYKMMFGEQTVSAPRRNRES